LFARIDSLSSNIWCPCSSSMFVFVRLKPSRSVMSWSHSWHPGRVLHFSLPRSCMQNNESDLHVGKLQQCSWCTYKYTTLGWEFYELPLPCNCLLPLLQLFMVEGILLTQSIS